MNSITVVTYLRKTENISENFKLFIAALSHANLLHRVIVFSETHKNVSSEWFVYSDKGRTKYFRIVEVISQKEDNIILSIDNDLDIDIHNAVHFCAEFEKTNAVIGWGLIDANEKSFIGKMISIDKTLSHCFIRPLLWKIHVGISIPGQLFIFKSEIYYNNLPKNNTFLDDLQIGLVTRCLNLKIFCSNKVMGKENVPQTFSDIFTQRRRWANGFASIIKNAYHSSLKHFLLVSIHGLSYHIFFSSLMISLLIMFFFYPVIILPCIFVILFFLAKFNVKKIPIALCYSIFFPFLHIYWGCHMLIYLQRR